MRPLSVLVVEDEELARERLARLVDEHEHFALAAACGNCEEAALAMCGAAVDIILLDVQMPGVSGLEFSERLSAGETPAPVFVFVTAHPQFACGAFDVQAADYLLKPFDQERFERALAAARERCKAREAVALAERFRSAFDATDGNGAAPPSAQARFVVRDNGRFFIVRGEKIDWIEADGRDCILHCGTEAHRIPGPLADLGARLPPERFIQVSRSSLVNIDRITQLHEMFKGDLVALMRNGEEVPVSRRFRTQVLARLSI